MNPTMTKQMHGCTLKLCHTCDLIPSLRSLMNSSYPLRLDDLIILTSSSNPQWPRSQWPPTKPDLIFNPNNTMTYNTHLDSNWPKIPWSFLDLQSYREFPVTSKSTLTFDSALTPPWLTRVFRLHPDLHENRDLTLTSLWSQAVL